MANNIPLINYDGLDPAVIPLVRYFNEHGLKTEMSCQGHNKTNMSMFWISFAPTVTEQDIVNFCYDHATEYGYPYTCGRFVHRFIFGLDRKMRKQFEYHAATIEAANQDLNRWKNDTAWTPEALEKFCSAQKECGGSCPNYAAQGCRKAHQALADIPERYKQKNTKD